jgi:hypothetical protein
MSFNSLLTSLATIKRRTLGTEDSFGVMAETLVNVSINVPCGIDTLLSNSEYDLYKAHLGGDTKSQLLRIFFKSNANVKSGDILFIQDELITEESSSSDEESSSNEESSSSDEESSSVEEEVEVSTSQYGDGTVEVLIAPLVTVRRHHIETICRYTKAL